MHTVQEISRAFAAAFGLVVASSAFAADDGVWVVRKFSGEVWTTTGDVQQASLKTDDVLMPGNTIRTGRNGRVLLVRGEESILIAPNSVIGLPSEKKEGPCDHHQAAGRLDPARGREEERQAFRGRDALPRRCGQGHPVPRHRERLWSQRSTSSAARVEVADFTRTGQIAQVLPGQHATTFASGNAGLRSAERAPCNRSSMDNRGLPRSIRVPVPRNGLTAPGQARSRHHCSNAWPPAEHGTA